MIRKIEWFFLFLLVCGVGILSVNWALKSTIHSQVDVIVPDLSHLSLNEALDTLSELNLGMKKEGAEFNDTLPTNTILRQTPPAGSTVREGKIIRLTLSQGGEIVFVPDLNGQPLRSAEVMLRNLTLSLGEIQTKPSIQYEKDVVIAQDPPVKTVVKKNTLVHLIVSNGPPEDGSILMPDFVGKNWTEAEAWAKKFGFSIEKKDDPKAAAGQGIVTAQDIAPDDLVLPKSKISFQVSANKDSNPAGGSSASRQFRFEVPQGESAKTYSFVLVDSDGTKEIWRGNLAPGTKHKIELPEKTGASARIRIFVNGILTEERNLQ